MLQKYVSCILKEAKIDKDIILKREELYRLIGLCRNNEILFYLLLLVTKQASSDKVILRLKSEKEALSNRIAEAATAISEAFNKRDLGFFIMKTFRSYPYTDDDMDIVMADRSRRREYVESLKEIGYEFKPDRSVLREPNKRFYVKKASNGEIQLPKVHLHSRVSWNGIEFLDAASVCKRHRRIDISGSEVKVPSVEDELLITSAHAIHENSYITIGELLHIKNLLSKTERVDTEYIISAARKYNWTSAMKYYFLHADLYYRRFTGERLLNEGLRQGLDIAEVDRTIIIKEDFPYLLPAPQLLGIYSKKVIKDLCSLKLHKIPREVLSFGVVTWLLRMKKKSKFRKKIGCS